MLILLTQLYNATHIKLYTIYTFTFLLCVKHSINNVFSYNKCLLVTIECDDWQLVYLVT